MASFRWTFSTLGCPEATWEEAAALAERFGMDALELRALEGTCDLPSIADRIRPGRIRVALLATTFTLVSNSPADREDLLRWARTADRLGAPRLRVFGGGSRAHPPDPAQWDHAVATIAWWNEVRGREGIRADLALETHHAFSSTAAVRHLQSRLPRPLDIVWDHHHTHRHAGESLEQSWDNLEGRVWHVQVNDSLPVAGSPLEGHLTLPGKGDMPVPQLLHFLGDVGYTGLISLEWERLWHPELPPLVTALQAARDAGWRGFPLRPA